ncbi:MAG: tyrosine-type recombinase/integrase [Thermogemmatispora sp.]|nr:tyrosine-type recombinase/integrase [Thermogemmatispora sp.]
MKTYLLAHKARGHSWRTLEDYERTLRLFFRYLETERGKCSIEQITAEDFHAWLAFLREGKSQRGQLYSSRSLQTYARNVLVYFRWLERQQYLQINPLANEFIPKVDKPLIQVFTEEELKRLDAACERQPRGRALTPDERKALAARDRAILWLLLSTGVRVSELCQLCLTDIDWKNNMLLIQGKGAKERKVPFGQVAHQYLQTYLRFWRGEPKEPDDHVFLSVNGRPLCPNGVRCIFERLKREAGITDKRVSPHTCRHWFAVRCIKKGMPTTALQQLLGHESLEMIDTYVRLADQDRSEIYQRFSPVDSLEMHQPSRRQELRTWRQARRRSPTRSFDREH